VARGLGLATIALVLAASAAVIFAGFATPGYDQMSRTVSRLAVPGMPFAGLVDAAIAAAGVACLALAAAIERRHALLLAGAGFVGAALVHLDPASPAATTAHRALTGVAVLGLAFAPFAARGYGRLSTMLGALAFALLVGAALLVSTRFSAWGAWERALLAVQVGWMVTTALKVASAEATIKAPVAIANSAGT
jgi:hypothetical protein